MSATNYIIDIALIAIVLRQLVPRQLTARSVLLPVVLVALAGLNYLKGFPTAGNDLPLILILIAIGAVLGVVSGTTTRLWNQQGAVWAKAGIVAASGSSGWGFEWASIFGRTPTAARRRFVVSLFIPRSPRPRRSPRHSS